METFLGKLCEEKEVRNWPERGIMGQAAIATKEFMQNNENFADAVNFGIFGGKQVIKAEQLHEMDSVEVMVPFGKGGREMPVERVRDILRSVTVKSDKQAVYAIIGIENQTNVHYAMPIKNMLYDALTYAGQISRTTKRNRRRRNNRRYRSGEFLSGLQKGENLLPVITLTIYFGAEEWDAPRSLHEMLNVQNEELLNYVSDYKLNLISPGVLSDEELKLFRSDLREVLTFIKYSKQKKELQKVILGNPRFQEMSRSAVQVLNACVNAKMSMEENEEEKDMCQALDEIRMEGKIEGKAEGKIEGKIEERIKLIQNLMDSLQLTVEQAMDALKISAEERKDIIQNI